ncbi:MAG TPA: translation initiation factor IF-5A [Candidatus Acidoferrales bacterium]|jgi:translation initiation factor 5A|nr:translation initiation factor IF-5A [Candidatus Acidoferrales bacterium]
MKEQTEIRTLKVGRYILIDDEPSTIVSLATSKPGKHGSAKARIDAVGIFDGQKRSIVQPVSAKIYVPIVERKGAQVLSVMGRVAQLMDLNDYSTFEIEIPPEHVDKLEAGKDVTYLESMGKRKLDVKL